MKISFNHVHVIHPSIIYTTIPSSVPGAPGVHPGQVTNISQGQNTRQFTIYAHIRTYTANLSNMQTPQRKTVAELDSCCCLMYM